jgi:hypothetical protein
MRKWIKPEISAIDINMTENGHNHEKWAEHSRSSNSQSGYYVPSQTPPAVQDDIVYPGGDSTPDTGDTNQFS